MLRQRGGTRRAGRSLGLVGDDVLPSVGVRRPSQRIDVNNIETGDLRTPRQTRELGKCRRLRRFTQNRDLAANGVIGVLEIGRADRAYAIRAAGKLAGGILP